MDVGLANRSTTPWLVGVCELLIREKQIQVKSRENAYREMAFCQRNGKPKQREQGVSSKQLFRAGNGLRDNYPN
jgi:hypothetical protein